MDFDSLSLYEKPDYSVSHYRFAAFRDSGVSTVQTFDRDVVLLCLIWCIRCIRRLLALCDTCEPVGEPLGVDLGPFNALKQLCNVGATTFSSDSS